MARTSRISSPSSSNPDWLITLPNPAYIFSMESHRILFANQLFADLLEYSVAELYALSLFDIRPAEDHALLSRALTTSPPQGASEWRYLTRTGSTLFVRLRYRDMRYALDSGAFERARFVAVISSDSSPTVASNIVCGK